MHEQEKSDWSAWTWSVVLLVFVVAIAVANMPHPPAYRSAANACVNNLRQLDAAANQFALENHLTNGDRINFPTDLTPYIKLDRNGKIPSCPAGGIYHLSKVGGTPACSLGTSVTPAHVLP